MHIYRKNELLSLIQEIDKKSSPNFFNMEAASYVANFFHGMVYKEHGKNDVMVWAEPSDYVLVFFCGEGRCGKIAKLVVDELKEHEYPKCEVIDVNYKDDEELKRLHGKFDSLFNLVRYDFDQKKYIFIDAILGLEDDFDNPKYQKVIAFLNAYPIISTSFYSIGVPSGLDADSGNCAARVINACMTFSFIHDPLGFYVGKGPEFCGNILTANFEIDDSCLENKFIPCTNIEELWNIASFPQRAITANKYDSGCVYLIGGGKGMPGAIKLAAEASLRVGAGLVRVGASSSSLPLISYGRPEIMLSDLDEESFSDYENWANALVIGPGLGRRDWALRIFESCIRSNLPKVVDADALYLLADEMIKLKNAIITPHEKEAARLLNVSVEYLRANRYNCVLKLAKVTGAVVVLKGHYTMICEDTTVFVCRNGCSAMAVGGMGDVLSGIIGGLIAEGLSLFDAAILGVAIHGRAGELAAKNGSIGTLPSDLMPHIRSIVNGFGINEYDDDEYYDDDDDYDDDE